MKALFEFEGKIFYDEDLKQSLKELKISQGDTLCVHTELFGFGKNVSKREEFLNTLLECFYEVLGEKGTLIMPTFTYSFCKKQDYDKQNSKSTMGVLTEFFRKQKGVLRTSDPIFSFAVKGTKAELFNTQTQSCFGKNCVYDLLAQNEGKILLFGTQKLGYTFTHFVEEKARVSYRYFKEFKGKIIDETGKEYEKTIAYYVRDLDKKTDLCVKKHIRFLQDDDNFQSLKFAGAALTLIKAKPYLDKFLSMLLKDENVLLKD